MCGSGLKAPQIHQGQGYLRGPQEIQLRSALARQAILNDLESVQLAYRHRDPFHCNHRSLQRRENGDWLAYGGLRSGHLNLAKSGHYYLGPTSNSSLLGTYGVVLRWFGFSDFVIFQREAGRLIHRMFPFSGLYCCASYDKGFVAFVAAETRNGADRCTMRRSAECCVCQSQRAVSKANAG